MDPSRAVLLVEDDFDLRQTIAEILADEGYEVVTAVDGQHALDLLHAGLRPRAILLDLMMAGMNGLQFRARQRQSPELSDIPVVVLTADRQIEQRARELDAAAFVRKPTQLEELLVVLDRLCRR